MRDERHHDEHQGGQVVDVDAHVEGERAVQRSASHEALMNRPSGYPPVRISYATIKDRKQADADMAMATYPPCSIFRNN